VAIFLGLVGVAFSSAFLCFDTCPHDLAGASGALVVRWLGIGLLATGCGWLLSLLECARAGRRRWLAALLRSLPITALVAEGVLWIAETASLADGWCQSTKVSWWGGRAGSSSCCSVGRWSSSSADVPLGALGRPPPLHPGQRYAHASRSRESAWCSARLWRCW
jgi:hypothetical protein